MNSRENGYIACKGVIDGTDELDHRYGLQNHARGYNTTITAPARCGTTPSSITVFPFSQTADEMLECAVAFGTAFTFKPDTANSPTSEGPLYACGIYTCLFISH